MSRPLRIVALTALWFALWLGLVEKLSVAELTIGAGCSVLVGAASELAWGEHLTAFSGAPRLLLQAWRLPKLFASGTWEIVVVLARHLFTSHKAQSVLRMVHFDAGAADDPEAAARRALAVAYTTMTPNFVIIGIDREARTMLYHQIAPSPVPLMTQKLGAGR